MGLIRASDLPFQTSQNDDWKVEAWYSGAGSPGPATLHAGQYTYGDRYFDTTGKVEWIINTPGSESTSVWQVGDADTPVQVKALVASHTASGLETGFTFSGLNGDTDIEYELVIYGKTSGGPGGGTDTVGVRFNGDANSANYISSVVYWHSSAAAVTFATNQGNALTYAYVDGLPDSGNHFSGRFWVGAITGDANPYESDAWEESFGGVQYGYYTRGEYKSGSVVITSIFIGNVGPSGAILAAGTRYELWAVRSVQ